MYAPPAYRLEDQDAAFDLAAANGFGILITAMEGEPALSHAPMLADRKRNVLRGHLSRANAHAALLEKRRHVAVFTGPNAYISPNWYADKTRVPTWNYAAAHFSGEGRLITEPAEIDAFLADISAHFENRRHDIADDTAWTLEKMPAGKLARMRKGIVVFEIAIDRIEAKAKLSQTDTSEDRAGAVRALSAGDDMQRAVAKAMRAASARA